MSSPHGITGLPAPELRVDNWIANADTPVRIADIDEPVIVLYNFQSWCPGCHSSGFPALNEIRSSLDATGHGSDVRFILIQTVFEGHETNTEAAALESVERHGLTDLALGHESGHPPTVMADYRTGGTPWTVIIGPRPDRTVLFDGFHVDAEAAAAAISEIVDEHNAKH